MLGLTELFKNGPILATRRTELISLIKVLVASLPSSPIDGISGIRDLRAYHKGAHSHYSPELLNSVFEIVFVYGEGILFVENKILHSYSDILLNASYMHILILYKKYYIRKACFF